MFSQFSFSRNIVTFIKYIFLSTLFTFAVYSQSLSETWNPPIYQPSEYSEFYGGVYFSNSLEEWDYKVEEVLFQSISQWKETAEIMVEQMLALEDGSDAFIANEGYLDERRKSLFSEVTVLYSAWERELMDDYFDNRNSFLHKLETGKVDSLYFQRIGQVSMYEEFTKEELKINENRNRILESAKEWEFQWNQTRQEGLDSFSNSFTELESDYQAYIQSLAETEIRFSDNLTAINSYKETIKTALREMVSQLQLGLDSECSVNTGCQYKNFDGSFNEAGKLFSKFIGDLALELNGPNIDPDSIFTLISTKIRDFLSNESNKAFSEYLRYHDQIYTYQTGFQINLDQTKTKFDLGGAQWNLRNQSFWQLSSDKRYENWLAGGSGEIGNFGRVYDSELRAIFQSIHNSNYQSLASIINGRLGEGRSVQSILSANLYTDVYNYINNEKLGDFYIPFDRAYHTSGNLLLDGKDKYGLWLAERYLSVGTPKRLDLQMGAIGYSVLYEMYDDNSYQTSLYWNGNYSQLGGQRDHFQNTLLPAVSHWETKVKEYSDFYENWKENRENLIADAKTKLDTNRMELERSKEDWLSRLEEEKRNGLNSWTELYKNGELAESPSPAISSWSPSSKWVPFQDAKLLEFKNSSIFDGSTENITIGNSNLLQDLQRSIVGVGQYASVLQMNNDLEELKLSEQKKLINQMAYEIRWDSLGGRELSKEEKILLGSYDVTQLSKEEQSRFGSCYENPEQSLCQSLLKREYETVIDTRNGVLTLKKEIHNGLLAGKNADGQYNAGKMEEVRHVQLSSIGKIQLTKTNDFFNIWNEEDWESLYQKKSEITESFLTHSLQNDKKFINSNLISIQEKDNRNQALYLERKESQESADSIFQELAVAYFTGGAAGVKASLKGKLESTINSEMAKAWVKATGGSESDIQTASMMVDFMRGRMSAKKIQSRDQYISIKNPIQAYESITAKALSAGQKILDYGAFGMSNVAVNLMQAPALALYKTLAGEKQYNKTNNQIAGTGKRLEEIKENEQMLVQNGISVAVSQATGLPIEEVSKMLGDKMNQIKAEKANKAMAKNPIFDFSSVLLGSTGGIIKTAVVAFGMPEDEIQSILKDANRISNAGNLSQNSSEDAYLGYTFQALGMKADWTQHKSNYLDLNDSKAVVEDLGKKAISKELAKSWGMDESAINQIVDSTYSTYQKQKADKKARAKAVRQTAVNAVSIAITLGASGALAGVNSVLSNIGKVASSITNGILPATAQVGQAVASTFVQTIAGSHEGPKGAIAGFANGVLGGVTQGMGKIQSGFFKGMVPGLGVSYSEKNGWGGSLGIGNNLNNISVSFSEKGDTTLQASKSLAGGVQIAADITTNGASNVGFNYNPTGKGPRKDANFSLMYDLNGGGLSGSIGYTDPNSKLGLTTSIDKDGVSASSELQGVTLGRNTKNGFEMQEMNFAEQNINAAQDESEIGAGDNSSEGKETPEQEGDFFRDFSAAGLALAGLLASGAVAAAKLFSGTSGPNSQGAEAGAGETLVLEKDRRKEEEGGDTSDTDLSSKEFTLDEGNDESLPAAVNDDILNILDGYMPDFSLPNLGLPEDIFSKITSLLSGENVNTPMAGAKDLPSWLRTFGPVIGVPISFNESGNNNNDSLVGNKEGDESQVKPLHKDTVQNSSESVRLNLIKASENPNVNSYKNGVSLKLNIPESMSTQESLDFTREKGLQIIKDAYFDYDGKVNSSTLLEKFAEHNGLSGKNSTPEQKLLYNSLQQELKTLRESTKGNLSNARIDYFRENYARITAEKLVSMYGDKIDTARTTGDVTYLKEGGLVLNNVIYDSQRDNEFNKWYIGNEGKYNLRPGSECSPTSTAMLAEYMGAKAQNGKTQFVDDFITQAEKAGILSDGKELQKDKYLQQVLNQYGKKLVELDDINGWKTESIKSALNAGNPVVVGGDFHIGPVDGGHRLVVVGYDPSGWIVHDPWGNANNSGYTGSGMYAHYDFGKWEIGKKTAFIIENYSNGED
ncbi:TIGR04388 family protein [Leptospira bandrabouensis]|uniref:TIGR04388 family protein n=1 Tax=Leptospira bandrabouensis TaxID=2484903 RepID=UPI00223CB24F|nr:TIGR04388 family protein [Leptospira bandrabouensis]MCW7459939.1 TIGR04388 family protein [Leptospira bandrabouensis]MCW7477184.1 TIGR04388 family protein [Leptospira bandrabouensis]MCW7484866.1 TIGR04388 family protein [Leptospira bandrabouensis]